MAHRAQPQIAGVTMESVKRAAHRAFGDGSLYTTVVGRPVGFNPSFSPPGEGGAKRRMRALLLPPEEDGRIRETASAQLRTGGPLSSRPGKLGQFIAWAAAPKIDAKTFGCAR